MPIPGSGPISMSMFNAEVSRTSNFENSILSGEAVPTQQSLVYIAGQLGPLDQNAPHSFSEWYGFAPTTTTTTIPPTTTTTTSTTTTTTTAAGTTTTSTTTTTTTACPCVCGVSIQNDSIDVINYTYQDCYNNTYSGSLKESETFVFLCPDPAAGTVKNNSVTTTGAAIVTYGSCQTPETTTTSTTTTTTTVVDCTFTGGSAVQACNFTVTEIQTTDPTNQQGTNGTATITFANATAPVTYTLNGVSRGTATSPLTINDLSANTSYTVAFTDANQCVAQATFEVGDTVFTFEANYLMLTYEFTNGKDLDTRTRIVTPNVGQVVATDYLGFGRQYKKEWPSGSSTPFEVWGGDNTATGFESVLINLDNFNAAYPSATSIVVDLRAFWFQTVGSNPVNVAAVLWKGGTPVKDGCFVAGRGYFCWTNPTATSTFNVDSVGTIITSRDFTSGQRVATLTYNLVTGEGLFNNNDTTTPSV